MPWGQWDNPEAQSAEDKGGICHLEVGPRHLSMQCLFLSVALFAGHGFMTSGLQGQKGADVGVEGDRTEDNPCIVFLPSLWATRAHFQWKSMSCLLSSLPKGKRASFPAEMERLNRRPGTREGCGFQPPQLVSSEE